MLYIYRSVRFQRIKKADYKESKLVYQTTPAPEIKNITHTHTHTHIYIYCATAGHLCHTTRTTHVCTSGITQALSRAWERGVKSRSFIFLLHLLGSRLRVELSLIRNRRARMLAHAAVGRASRSKESKFSQTTFADH